MSAPLGQSVDELALALARIKGVTVDDALRFLGGKGFSSGVQANLMARGAEASRLGRFATGRLAGNALRAVPLVGTAMTALDAADIVTNDTSLGNKAMDAAAMAIGGTIGMIGGPLGAATGASVGKMTSDGIQYLFGDKKSPEQRKMEEALMMLQRGSY
jgi:hypothetical protein